MILIKEIVNKIKYTQFLILLFFLCTLFSCFNFTKNLNNDVVKIKDKNDSLINKNSFVLSIKDTKTIYKNIFSLPPGHYLKYQDNKIQVQKYWDTPKPTMIIDEHYAIEKFEYLLNKSIKNF